MHHTVQKCSMLRTICWSELLSFLRLGYHQCLHTAIHQHIPSVPAMLLTYSLLVGINPMGSQSSYTDITTIDLVNIPDAAIDDCSSPLIILRLLNWITTQYGTAYASTPYSELVEPFIVYYSIFCSNPKY